MAETTPIANRWRLVRRTSIPRHLRHLLLIVMHYQNNNESAWCKRETLADELGITRDVVSQQMKELEKIGVLDRIWKSRNGRPSREYAIQFSELAKHQRSLRDASTCSLSESSECIPSSLSESSTSVLGMPQGHSEESLRHEVTSEEPVEEPFILSDLKSNETDFSKWFDEFWNAFSKKVARKKAEPAFKRAVKSETKSRNVSMAEAARHITAIAGKYAAGFSSGNKYQQHPTAWLNGERWNDEPSSWNHSGGDQSSETEQAWQSLLESLRRHSRFSPDHIERDVGAAAWQAAKSIGLKKIDEANDFDRKQLSTRFSELLNRKAQ